MDQKRGLTRTRKTPAITQWAKLQTRSSSHRFSKPPGDGDHWVPKKLTEVWNKRKKKHQL